MDPKDIRTLKILEQVQNGNTPSQRALADELNISLGLVNSFIKRLVKKGFVKITSIPKKRIKYILTPRGAAEKTRLTYLYIQYSYHFYKDARQKLRELYEELEQQSVSRIVFYGVEDLAEIAYVSLQETTIHLVGVVDDVKTGTHFLKMRVMDPADLNAIVYDRILITALHQRTAIKDNLLRNGVASELVVQLN